MQEQSNARSLQLSIDIVDVQGDDGIEPAIATAKKAGAEALLCWFGTTGVLSRERMAKKALQEGSPPRLTSTFARTPAVCCTTARMSWTSSAALPGTSTGS